MERDSLVEMTWVPGAAGTKGAETVVTVELTPPGGGAHVKLTHAGFADEESKNRQVQAWPEVHKQLDLRMTTQSQVSEAYNHLTRSVRPSAFPVSGKNCNKI